MATHRQLELEAIALEKDVLSFLASDLDWHRPIEIREYLNQPKGVIARVLNRLADDGRATSSLRFWAITRHGVACLSERAAA